MIFALFAGCADPGAPAPVVETPAHLEEGGRVECADPAAREGAPFRRMDLGGSFSEGATTPWNRQGLAVADLDGDGALDLVTPALGGPTGIWMARGGGWVDEGATRAPTDAPLAVSGVVAVDVEGDGDADLALSQIGAPPLLWLNDGAGVFRDASAEAGLPTEARIAQQTSWGDVDGDGDLDALSLEGGGPPPVCDEGGEWVLSDPSEFWINNGDGTFSVSTSRLPPDGRGAYTMAGGLLHLDGDGLIDAYLINDYGWLVIPSEALVNGGEKGGFVFSHASGLGLDLAMAGMGLGLGDLNGDGVVDLAISGWDEVRVLVSEGDAGWFDQAEAMGVHQQSGPAWGMDLADVDNDGDLDLFVGLGQVPPDPAALAGDSGASDCEITGLSNPADTPDRLYLQEDGAWTDVAPAWGQDDPGAVRALALVDLDGDGWLDVVRRSWEGSDRLDLASCGENAWIEVALRQEGPNRQAVGAVVEIEAGGRTQRRWITLGTTSYSTGLPPEAHFGLGAAEEVERLRVVWPDGTASELGPVQGRQRVVVVRDDDGAAR